MAERPLLKIIPQTGAFGYLYHWTTGHVTFTFYKKGMTIKTSKTFNFLLGIFGKVMPVVLLLFLLFGVPKSLPFYYPFLLLAIIVSAYSIYSSDFFKRDLNIPYDKITEYREKHFMEYLVVGTGVFIGTKKHKMVLGTNPEPVLKILRQKCRKKHSP